MTKIAIISDVHGNLEALQTVLKDIENRGIEKIYCLGDTIAKGTHQQECIDIVRKKCEVIIRGNVDRFFSNELDLSIATEDDIKRYNWIKNKINEETKDFLRNLPFSYEFYLSGRLVRLVHAHPERDNKFIGNVDSISNLYSLVLPSENTISNNKADVLIYGHIHMPFMQKMYNRYILNTGSVGDALDVIRNEEKDADVSFTSVVNYLILSGELDSKVKTDDISFEFISLSYDIGKELSSNSDNAELDEYVAELKTGLYRDMSKVYKTFEDRGIDKNEI